MITLNSKTGAVLLSRPQQSPTIRRTLRKFKQSSERLSKTKEVFEYRASVSICIHPRASLGNSRCTGHSWSPIFGRDQKKDQKNNGDVLISTLTKWNSSVLPNFTSLPSSLFQPKKTELNHIMEVDAAFVHGPTLDRGKKYVRVGTSTTNEEFRRWCINEGHVTLPMNIIEVEITMGGSNATIW